MKILVLDELHSVRPDSRAWESLCSKHSVKVVASPAADLGALGDLREVEVLAFGSSFYDWSLPTDLLARFPNLRALCISGGWHEFVDLAYCRARGIVVTNVPDFASVSSAEWCLMATLMLARRTPLLAGSSTWPEDVPGVELAGKIAGIVGLGGVGKALARIVSAIGMKCIYWSRRSRHDGHEYRPLEELLAAADVVYLTFYEARRMRRFMGKDQLQLLKPSAFLVSGLGSQPRLESDSVEWRFAIERVQSGMLGGLAVEIGEHEIVPRVEGNVYIAPGHAGWCTFEALRRQADQWVENVLGVLDGTAPNIVANEAEPGEDGH